ncbi:DUF115 domain-containing protein [Serpentinicella sp. ANB-PHB4]|uniref:motility associated factor glycosyltransferase family protein n=1 Tax=Serpentinicella sp. ANB-PHB4 TaxID=3074076 RepID=UPI00285EC16C|nr:6-hydroxymethylpterin diphosphokinase MptE-like protein [Serpentinicella sp. ANB-PHB4]MDR5659778.1 DUF115 domain-containing protein [Serpentinicella sp. ANB-PHB4]
MILADNITFLKKRFPSFWHKLKSLENNLDMQVHMHEVRSGDKTLYIQKNDKKTFIHSKYNPQREAEALFQNYQNLDEETHFVFYGIGLGHHIKKILEAYPNATYSIYEPVPEVMNFFLSQVNLTKLRVGRLRHIEVEQEESNVENFIYQQIEIKNEAVAFIPLPSYERIFGEKYNCFLRSFREGIKDKRSMLHTNYAFQKRWIINGMMNLKDVLTTPNVLMQKNGVFKEKPAIIVSAGPSLNEEIENLKYIKENGLAYIFAVGSSNKTLLKHNIYPHAVTSYDPQGTNYKVFNELVEKNITDIPLIFGSSVGYETVEKFPGPKYHMLTNQDSTTQFYLKPKLNQNLKGVVDAPTIAVITLQLIYELGFSKIVFVGQNLGLLGEIDYAEGIKENNQSKQAKNTSKHIVVKDVQGKNIKTTDGFNRMRLQLEKYISYYMQLNRKVDFINTTQGGAHIQGTEFIPLEEIIERDFKETIFDPNWLSVQPRNFYDKEFLSHKQKEMQDSLSGLKNEIVKFENIVENVMKLKNNRNIKQLEKEYGKFDMLYSKLKENTFMKTYIIPMSRVEYEIIIKEIKNIKIQSNPVKKADKFVKTMSMLLGIIKRELKNLESPFNKMNNDILNLLSLAEEV